MALMLMLTIVAMTLRVKAQPVSMRLGYWDRNSDREREKLLGDQADIMLSHIYDRSPV